MKSILKKIFKFLNGGVRGIIVSLILLAFVALGALYVVLSLPSVQERMKSLGQAELSRLLGSEVSVGTLEFTPLNRLMLNDVVIPDLQGDTLLSVDRLGVGLSLYNLVFRQRLVLTYAEVIGLQAHLNRPDAQSPTNAQFIIDALSSKQGDKEPSAYDLKIYNIVIRKSALSYDVLDQAPKGTGFDPNHIAVTNLSADIAIPVLKNGDCLLGLKRLSLKEHCGFSLKNITATARIDTTSASLSGLKVELEHSALTLSDISIGYRDISKKGEQIKDIPVKLESHNSYITPSDLAGFAPVLHNFNERINITFSLTCTGGNFDIDTLRVETANKRFLVDMSGQIDSIAGPVTYNLPAIELKAYAEELASITENFATLTPQTERIIANCGDVHARGSISGDSKTLKFTGNLETTPGELELDGVFAGNDNSYKGSVGTQGFDIGMLIGNEKMCGEAAFNVSVDVKLDEAGVTGTGKGIVDFAEVNGYRYRGIEADLTVRQNLYTGNVQITDENIILDIDGQMITDNGVTLVNISAQASDISLANLNISPKYPGHRLAFDLDVLMQGRTIEDAAGNIELRNLALRDSAGTGVGIENFLLTAAPTDSVNSIIQIVSDVVNGSITGSIDYKNLIPAMRNMLAQSLPSIIETAEIPAQNRQRTNDFDFNLSIYIPPEMETFFKLPVGILVPATLSGHVDEAAQTASLEASATYLGQKNKLIEDTWLSASIGGPDKNSELHAHTIMPVKKGKVDINVDINCVNNRIDTNVEWVVPREADFSGQLSVSTLLWRHTQGDSASIAATIDINPTKIVFNDTAWQMHPAKIKVEGTTVDIDGFKASCSEQFISLDGRVSQDENDEALLVLNDINLNYIFETLGIETAMFGGRGTGTFHVSGLYTKMPRIATPSLYVEGIEYNNAYMGDADIVSEWNVDKQEVEIHAVISQENGGVTLIDGGIFPMCDSLYFEFRPERANAKFLGPYMSAFASDVEGRASGFACLYGTFSDINLYGDVYADTLMVKLDITNTRYYVYGDSVKMVPGRISFKDVTLYDSQNHTANLTGWVSHEFFHNPRFNFQVTQARDFLCYDMPPGTPDQNWYGTVYGDGTVKVVGEPGLVEIDVNVKSAKNSTFTYELSDEEIAYEYDFITFTDRTPREYVADTVPERVRELLNLNKAGNSGDSDSDYRINIFAEITNDAQINLVMDPVGGDQIRSRGTGSLRMTYSSDDELLTMHGSYTIQQGRYNFTLQDIIVREFTIQEGSSISFTGDPFAAQVDITAYYTVNANLLDLDESFSTDKDMNRTNVPVRTLLKVSGLITEPDISFDLAFTTLTQEADRKVRSVISTDDMMNRQIIYLLALNRFYTPEYMSSTTSSNNELASVASSTISSQLTSILGQLSDNWSIAPNFHSDKGDFSDVEVELALSSQLLNNRLLLNGNFGYRDNTLNSSTNFVGDFDIEYLLTKNGNIRLKAYNHFNDQNYYIKSALTTQGVGVVFKHDFDRPFDFLKKKTTAQALTPATVEAQKTDSVK